MPKSNHEQWKKLLQKTKSLIKDLDNRNDLIIHQNINQFYYMQKNEELAMLMEMLSKATQGHEAITSSIELNYYEISRKWCRDVRWLSKYLQNG